MRDLRGKRIAFIAVSYNSDEETVEFARALASISAERDAIAILVDNGPHTPDRAFQQVVNRANASLTYISANANLGYFGGAELARKWLAERGGDLDWVIVSNVDLEFARDFTTVLRARAPNAGVGVLAPSIWSKHIWRDLNPNMVARPRSQRMRFYQILFRHFWLLNSYEIASAVKHRFYGSLAWVKRKAKSGASGAEGPHQEERPVYAAHGSCIVFSRAYFEAGGTFQYPSFLFGEEIFVAEFCRQHGLQVVYSPSLRVSHDDHVSTGVIRSRRMAEYVAKSADFLATEYFS